MALLPVERKNAHFHAAVGVRTEEEAVALICLFHVGKFAGEDVVTAILTLFLSRHRVNVLDRQVLVQVL